jgi:hypothetical protein
MVATAPDSAIFAQPYCYHSAIDASYVPCIMAAYPDERGSGPSEERGNTVAEAKTVTYHVSAMRVTFPSPKVAAKNPERFCTVAGTFADAKNVKLSIVTKNVTKKEAADARTIIDQPKGILTLPAGQRGRKPAVSAAPDTIQKALAALRTPKATAK